MADHRGRRFEEGYIFAGHSFLPGVGGGNYRITLECVEFRQLPDGRRQLFASGPVGDSPAEVGIYVVESTVPGKGLAGWRDITFDDEEERAARAPCGAAQERTPYSGPFAFVDSNEAATCIERDCAAGTDENGDPIPGTKTVCCREAGSEGSSGACGSASVISDSGVEVLKLAGCPRPNISGGGPLFGDCFFGSAPCAFPAPPFNSPEACIACLARSADGVVTEPPNTTVEGVCTWVAGTPVGSGGPGGCDESDAVQACEACGCATETACSPRQ